MALQVTIWNEFRHEKEMAECAEIYPAGMHAAIGRYLEKHTDFAIELAALDDADHGLGADLVDETDVMVWWGHTAHDEVPDEAAERVRDRVLDGMGLIALHSSIHAKVFQGLMGTSCDVKWREAGEKERLWVIAPGHPIVEGIDEYIEIEQSEMYGEHFDIPPPDETVFLSWFPGGEVFRSGCCFLRGRGKVFYFRPGHETYPVYHNEDVLRVITNAIRWAAPVDGPEFVRGNVDPLEPIG